MRRSICFSGHAADRPLSYQLPDDLPHRLRERHDAGSNHALSTEDPRVAESLGGFQRCESPYVGCGLREALRLDGRATHPPPGRDVTRRRVVAAFFASWLAASVFANLERAQGVGVPITMSEHEARVVFEDTLTTECLERRIGITRGFTSALRTVPAAEATQSPTTGASLMTAGPPTCTSPAQSPASLCRTWRACASVATTERPGNRRVKGKEALKEVMAGILMSMALAALAVGTVWTVANLLERRQVRCTQRQTPPSRRSRLTGSRPDGILRVSGSRSVRGAGPRRGRR